MSTSNPPVSVRPELAPFDPLQIYIMGVIFAPVGTAALIAINWRRLGKANRVWLTIVISIVALLALQMLYSFVSFLLPNIQIGESLLIAGVCNLIFALVMVQWQRKTYLSWKTAYGSSEPSLQQRGGCRSILLIVAVIVIFDVAYVLYIAPVVATRITMPIIAGSQSPHTFQDASYAMTYPGVWIAQDLKQVDYDSCIQGKCLLVLRSMIHGEASFTMVRLDDPALQSLSLDAIEQQFWEHVQTRFQNARSDKPEAITVDGQPAIQRTIFHKVIDGSKQIQDIVIFVQQKDGKVMRIEAVTDINVSVQLGDDIQKMIASILFL